MLAINRYMLILLFINRNRFINDMYITYNKQKSKFKKCKFNHCILYLKDNLRRAIKLYYYILLCSTQT